MILRFALMACLVVMSQVAIAATPDPWHAIAQQVEKIKKESSSTSRPDEAERLADLVKQKAAHVIPESLLAEITDLLTDRDDTVRYWTAMALGYLGPQAASSIPALEKALKEIEKVRGSKTSASGIRFALAKIRAANK